MSTSTNLARTGNEAIAARNAEAKQWSPETKAALAATIMIVGFVAGVTLFGLFAETHSFLDSDGEWGDKVFNISKSAAEIGMWSSFGGMIGIPVITVMYMFSLQSEAYEVLKDKSKELYDNYIARDNNVTDPNHEI